MSKPIKITKDTLMIRTKTNKVKFIDSDCYISGENDHVGHVYQDNPYVDDCTAHLKWENCAIQRKHEWEVVARISQITAAGSKMADLILPGDLVVVRRDKDSMPFFMSNESGTESFKKFLLPTDSVEIYYKWDNNYKRLGL